MIFEFVDRPLRPNPQYSSASFDTHPSRRGAMRPTGTVTLLFSDIDGSTRLLRSIGVQRYEKAIAQHRLLLREAFARRPKPYPEFPKSGVR